MVVKAIAGEDKASYFKDATGTPRTDFLNYQGVGVEGAINLEPVIEQVEVFALRDFLGWESFVWSMRSLVQTCAYNLKFNNPGSREVDLEWFLSSLKRRIPAELQGYGQAIVDNVRVQKYSYWSDKSADQFSEFGDYR